MRNEALSKEKTVKSAVIPEGVEIDEWEFNSRVSFR